MLARTAAFAPVVRPTPPDPGAELERDLPDTRVDTKVLGNPRLSYLHINGTQSHISVTFP